MTYLAFKRGHTLPQGLSHLTSYHTCTNTNSFIPLLNNNAQMFEFVTVKFKTDLVRTKLS